jgi:tRNA (adenine37-N6)-methyltransferase
LIRGAPRDIFIFSFFYFIFHFYCSFFISAGSASHEDDADRVCAEPHTETSSIPKGPNAVHTAEGVLEIRPDLEAGLTDIEGFSHLYVIWAFHRSEGYDLMTTPPSDDRPHGLFGTRTPRRPNPIALSVVELLRRDGHRLHVRGIDMLDGTPILDIKPYLSSVPDEKLRRGWLEGK